jgi:hypothetical protein
MNLSEQVMGDEAAWAEQLYSEEREALRRVANGISDITDAALLAGSLGHKDLFANIERVRDEI